VECANDSKPDDELWFYDQTQGLLLGFDDLLHQSLGSFGPDGFTPPGQQSRAHFTGELIYRHSRWEASSQKFLTFPDAVCEVNFSRRTIRSFFAPGAGETAHFPLWWDEPLGSIRFLAVMSGIRSIYFLTSEGCPVVFLPRDDLNHNLVIVGVLDNPDSKT